MDSMRDLVMPGLFTGLSESEMLRIHIKLERSYGKARMMGAPTDGFVLDFACLQRDLFAAMAAESIPLP